MPEPPPRSAWLLLHPLLLTTVAGLLAGDAAIGFIAAVALTPWLADRDEVDVTAVLALAAGVVAAVVGGRSAMGGILVPAWIGSTLAVVALVGVLASGAQGRGRAALAGGAVVVLGLLVPMPAATSGLAPWVSGVLFLVGCGVMAGLAPSPVRSRRRLATAAALVASNVAGPFGIAALPIVELAGAQGEKRGLRPAHLQVAAAVVAVGAALLLTWVPYELPAWPHPMLQLPSGDIAMPGGRFSWGLPLLAVGAVVGRAARRP